jgi:hypothetical protein
VGRVNDEMRKTTILAGLAKVIIYISLLNPALAESTYA